MRNLVRLCCALAVASLITAASSPTAVRSYARARALAGATITVNSASDAASNDGLCTLREAIASANTNSPSGAAPGECAAGTGDDTIDFSVTGTINLAGALPDLSTNVTISGPGSAQLTVRRDTGGDYRIFNVIAGTVGISGLTATNGKTPDASNGVNFADGGGGISNAGALTLTDVTVSGNKTGIGFTGPNGENGGRGGGIFNTGTLTLTDCVVTLNGTGKGGDGAFISGSGGWGGGIHNDSGSVTLTRTEVSGNITGDGGHANTGGGQPAGVGGGLFNNTNAVMTLTDCTVNDNKTGVNFDGLRTLGGGMLNQGTLTITGSTIYNNTGVSGSAIYAGFGSALKMTNSTVSLNFSSVAIEVNSTQSATTLTNCTIYSNSGGGVEVSSALAPVVRNTIIAGNGSVGPVSDVSGSFNSQGHNLVGDGDGATGFGASGDQVGTAASRISPRLSMLGSYGGPTPTHSLLTGSPALDAGDNALAKDAANNTLTTDQRGAGFPRFADSGDADTTATVDIGAFEAGLTVEDIPDKTTGEDSTLSFNFNIGDMDPNSVSVTASSSNTSLVPNNPANISVTGTGSQRTLSITPVADASGLTNITVTATATGGGTATDTFLLTVTPANDAPTALALSNTTVADNSPGPTTVGTFSTTDKDAGDTFTYTLVPGVGDTDNLFFFINGSTLTGGRFDFETKPVYSVRVRSTDSGGGFVEKQFLITVTDGPDAPGALSFTASNFTASESDGTALIRLTRTGGADNKVTAKVNLSDVTTSAADYVYSPGALDAAFNPGGEGASSHSSGLAQYVSALGYQVDGKVIIGGAFLFYNGLQRGRLARIESNGDLDVSFDSGVGANGPVNAIAVQPDGRVIIAGAFSSYNNVSRNRIARLNDDGTLDTTFNTSGPNGNLYVLTLQPDGKILVGGTFNSFGGSSARRQIVRLNSDGSLDPTFNPVGTNFAGTDTDSVEAIALQPDGKIVVGGGFVEFSGVTNTRMLRLNSDGSVDNTFTPSLGISMAVRDIVLQADGKPIAVGEFIGNDTPYGKKGVVRLNTDGTVDATFDPGTGTNGGTVESVVLQPDGKPVIGGWFTSYNGTSINRLARLNTNGSLDTSFNPGDGPNSSVLDLLIDPGGRIYIGGLHTFYNNIASNGITRVRGDLFVTWNPGETFNRAISLPIVDDSLTEPSETLSLTLTPLGGATAGAITSATLTITDNDALPTAVSPVSGSGPYSGTATLTATLTKAGGVPVPGKSITFTLSNNNVGSATTNASGVATLSGVTLQGLGAGSYSNVVGASFAGDIDFMGSNGRGTLTVVKADTTTTVTVSNATYDGNPHGGTATVTGPGGLNQSLTVTYAGRNSTAYGPSTTAPTSAGDYTASATYAGSSNYNAGSDTKNFSVAKASQTITLNALSDKTYGDADFTVSATASSGLSVSLSGSGACTVTGSTVHITGAGSCTVTASQAGDSNHNAAASVARSFNVAKASQTITFGTLSDKTYGDADFTVSATASSGLAVSLVASGRCSLTGSALHITGAGSCAITASRAGDSNHNAAASVARSFDIAKAATATAVASSAGTSASGRGVTFTATVTSSAGVPAGAVRFKVDGAGVGAAVALDGAGVATLTTSGVAAGAHSVTADYGGGANFNASSGALAGGQTVGSLIGFSQSSYGVAEGASLTVTVRRTGDTTEAASVDYATEDGSAPGVVVPCSSVTGMAVGRCDYTEALGTLHFAAGETEKTFAVLGGDDSYVEGPETASLRLSNPSGGSTLASNSTAVFTISDDSPESTGNPTDDDEKFITQHYRDFLNRDPDASGLAFWKGQITSCGRNAQCREAKRVHVSAAFFLSIEFQETGYLVERAYKTAYGDATSPNVAGTVPVIRLDEFLPDTQRIGRGLIVGQGAWEQQLEANKVAYFGEFVSRQRFADAYPSSMTPAQFVDALFANAGVTPTAAERQAAIGEFGGHSNSADLPARGRALRRVAEHSELHREELNRAFVLMEYFGYLRRNPDDAPEATLNYAGWRFWLDKLDQFDGDFVKAEMVKAFITSDEYRHRFGQ